jgi:L-amino acid N-acyltransferase
MAVQIRLAEAADLPAINAIYNHYVRTSTATYQEEESTDAERATWFKTHGREHPVTVAVHENADGEREIVGWGSLNGFHPRSAYRFTVEDSLYVRHDMQRRGIGRKILSDLLERAAELGHQQVIALISADQPRSIELHRHAGFSDAGRLQRVGLKFGRWLDLVYMQWSAVPGAHH